MPWGVGSGEWGVGGNSHFRFLVFRLSEKLVFVRIFGFIIDKFLGKCYADIMLTAATVAPKENLLKTRDFHQIILLSK